MISDSTRFIRHAARIFVVVATLSGICIIVHLLNGCGKTGFPQPQDESRSFAWEEVDAGIVGRCIAFTGGFTGAYRNFDGIRLEIDSLSGPEDCPGCPFVPDDVAEIPPKDAGFNARDGRIAFSYCPQPAAAYRWRLAGISSFNRLPHATMLDRLLIVNP